MTLLRQAARGIWRNKRAYIACIFLLSMGVMMYIAFNLMSLNLTGAMLSTYREKQFGDGFASVKSMPVGDIAKVEAVPGVRGAAANIVTDATVDRPSFERTVTLRLSSFDPPEMSRINDFEILEGTMPSYGGVLISKNFADAGDYLVGDEIILIIGGNKVREQIAGFVISPEYVYAIPDSGQLMPDYETFGFGYMTTARLAPMSGNVGTANRVSFLLEENVPYSAVEPYMEEVLRPYGLAYLIPREDQISHNMLQTELNSIAAMSSAVPTMMILLAVIILYIMLKRIIEQERSSIGTLKAMGFSDAVIMLHYISYGAIVGLMGGVVGVAFGLITNAPMTDLMLTFFDLPAARTSPDIALVLSGVAIAFLSGAAGAFMGTIGILKLSPVEAMRPPAPPVITVDILGKVPFISKILASHGYMAARNISRGRLRSAVVVLGLSISFGLMAFMASYGDMFDVLLLNQFTKVQLYNVKVTLDSPVAYTPAIEAAYALEGVRRAEGILEVPVELRNEHRKKSTAIVAMEADSSLFYIYDNDLDVTLPAPYGGVVLANSLAKELGAARGDVLTMHTTYTADEGVPLPVVDVVSSSLGATGYIAMESLWELLDIPPTATGLLLDAADPIPIKDALLNADNVSGTSDLDESMAVYEDMIETYIPMTYMMQIAGIAIAFAIITNTASISLSERKREYATMRVMGMHPREIGKVVAFEYWILFAASILPGIGLTALFKRGISDAINNDVFAIPMYTEPRCYVVAAVLCILTITLSNLSANRKISRFDMVEVLKERE